MRTQPLINLVQRLKKTEDKDEKEAISKILRHTDEILTGKQQNEVPRTIKDIAENLEKIFGGRVEIHRIEFPQNKRRYRKPKEGKRK